jgi:hypothetical protein
MHLPKRFLEAVVNWASIGPPDYHAIFGIKNEILFNFHPTEDAVISIRYGKMQKYILFIQFGLINRGVLLYRELGMFNKTGLI